jgi:hypothetical protein
MIPKSGNRFSGKITLKAKHCKRADTRQALFIEASSRRHGGGPDYLSLIEARIGLTKLSTR